MPPLSRLNSNTVPMPNDSGDVVTTAHLPLDQIPYAPSHVPDDRLAFRIVGLGTEACLAVEALHREGYGCGRDHIANVDFVTCAPPQSFHWWYFEPTGDGAPSRTSQTQSLVLLFVSDVGDDSRRLFLELVAVCRSRGIPTVVGIPAHLRRSPTHDLWDSLSKAIAQGASVVWLPDNPLESGSHSSVDPYRALVQTLTAKYLYFGFICLDWSDVESFIGAGRTLRLGWGRATGLHRAWHALGAAIASMPKGGQQPPGDCIAIIRWGKDAHFYEYDYSKSALQRALKIEDALFGDFVDWDSDGVFELMFLCS